jgi:acyl transferase domain-containing protein/NAD(P)-dependent dehydrogenase (short-subunit alcohol dehydrogenase family)/acyl carrier protein
MALPMDIELIGLRRSWAVAGSILEGLALSASLETTRLRFQSVVSACDPNQALAMAIARCRQDGGVRFRFDGRALWRETLKAIEEEPIAGCGLQPHGCYVITGGGGGVGTQLAGWLVRRFQAKVFILGRTNLHEGLRARLLAQGVKSYIQADVTDLEALAAGMTHALTSGGLVNGVFHLAGAIDDRLMINKDPADIRRILAPKIGGALNLWRLQGNLTPGFVCNFSSISGLIGNIGQADYAAANTFLDALSLHASETASREQPWHSINWGLWDSDGMQAAPTGAPLHAMNALEACGTLEGILGRSTPLVVVQGGPSFRLNAPPPSLTNVSGQADPGPVNYTAVLTAVISWLEGLVYKLTRLQDLDADASLIAMGVESSALISFVTAIERRLRETDPGINLRKAEVFDHPTLRGFAGHLLQVYPQALATLFSGPSVAPSAMRSHPSDNEQPMAHGSEDKAPSCIESCSARPLPSAPGPEAIAIIGIAGEFPGADNLEELWSLLESGREAITEIPPDRWPWQRDYSPDPQEGGKSYGRHGGFLRRAKQFDAAFFGITPIEAVRIDPQERRLLEMAYHALEDSGHFAAPNGDTGVFTVAMFAHYQDLGARPTPVNSSFASIANRISYTFNFQGPSLCVDTMCSGALTALHLAIRCIQAGDCHQALVGAVNLMPHAGKLRLLSDGRFLSPTGRCNSFGVGADGYVPGEGAVVVIIKRLQDALSHGDRIHGIIRGTSINSGGRTGGFTVPSPHAQEQVILQALRRSGVDPVLIDGVEAHGTGTSLGDPIEVGALSAAYGRRDGPPRFLGSIKSNIGHLESAAGLAGLAKLLLQFHHRSKVATLNCDLVNPLLDLETSGFHLPRHTEPWEPAVPVAGLSSFGAGGSNAHLIVQGWCAPQYTPPRVDHCLVPLSGRTPRALAARVLALSSWLDRNPDASLYAIAHTLGVCREHFRQRTCFVADNVAMLRQRLKDYGEDQPDPLPADLDLGVRAVLDGYLAGEPADFASLYPIRSLASLPHYEFEPQDFWHVPDAAPTQASSQPPAADREEVVTFAPQWRREDLPASAGPRTSREANCVVICGARQAHELRAAGFNKVIEAGAAFKLDEASACVRAESVEDWVAALGLFAEEGQSLPALINLLEPDGNDEQGLALLRGQCALAKALAGRGTASRMILVHGEGEGRWPVPIAGALPSLFQCAAMEEGHWNVVSLKVVPSAFDRPAELVTLACAELENAGEAFRAFRWQQGQRWTRRLEEQGLLSASGSRLRQQGVYLVTGGLGMIAMAVAEKVLSTFDASLILVGRTPVGAETEAKLARMRRTGGRVEYIAADITQGEEVTILVDAILARHGTLHGVFHMAAVMNDGLLRNKTPDELEPVFAVKMVGARNLDRATAHLPLDFFVIFSSTSGLFGHVGQGAYAAANQYLDDFASGRQREVESGRRQGFTLSIDWPLWLDPGYSPPSPAQDHRPLGRYIRDQFGIGALGLQEGADLTVRLLDHSTLPGQIAPFVGDLTKIRACLAEGVLQAPPLDSQVPPSPGHSIPVPRGETVEATPRLEVIQALREIVGSLSGLSPHDMEDEATFGNLGFNSVMLQNLGTRVEERFGVAMPASALFSYNSIDRLADHLRTRSVARSEDSVTPQLGAEAHPAPLAKQGILGKAMRRAAIIGIDGRLPGSHDLEGFWATLVANHSAVQRMERWPKRQDLGGTIPEFAHFDAKFFGISAREATLMDPQHRLFLQSAYNAMLDAGVSPRSVTRVGVFVGVQFSDYQVLLQGAGQGGHPYAATGNAHAMLANRVSYLFDFDGPSETVDTACSSSLVALNRAVLALDRGECDFALVGAVSLLIDGAMTDAANSLGVLSPRHRCATFDAEADGYVRGEGVGCLLLRRLQDAEQDRDSIYAVIEATAVNHGGRAHSLTAPNPIAQQRLLMDAYDSDLARRVSYIEAHGTGTRLGDPVETDALKRAWQTLLPGRSGQRVLLGSVKSNVGHLEPAAGMASILKVILAMKHRTLPATIHFNRLNPMITLEGSPFQIASENSAWGVPGRVAGISSFGFGGTNAHVVLADAPAQHLAPEESGKPFLIVLSAKTPASLMKMKEALWRHLIREESQGLPLVDVARTLTTGREHFECRLAWIAGNLHEVINALARTGVEDIRHAFRITPLSDAERQPSMGKDAAHDLVAARERYLEGVKPDWDSLFQGARGRRVHLPTYAFETREFWFEKVP